MAIGFINVTLPLGELQNLRVEAVIIGNPKRERGK